MRLNYRKNEAIKRSVIPKLPKDIFWVALLSLVFAKCNMCFPQNLMINLSLHLVRTRGQTHAHMRQKKHTPYYLYTPPLVPPPHLSK